MKRLCETTPNSVQSNYQGDRISELPKPLLHHILSFLPTKDASRTSTLSKFWYSTWKSFPVLDFDQYAFQQAFFPAARRNNCPELEQHFCNYINNTINSRTGITSIQKFKVVVNFRKCANTRNGDLNRWLIYAAHKKVKELTVIYHTNSRATAKWQYVLPQTIIHNKALQSLDLFGCQFIVSSVTSQVAFSLTTLKLCHVQTDTATLQTVISNCCLLQALSLELCKGFDMVRVATLKLRVLSLYLHRDDVQIFAADSPNLYSLTYGGGYQNVQRSLLNSTGFDRLKQLTFRDTDLEANISRFLQRFPQLQKLEFLRCCLLEALESSDANLVEVSISQCLRLKKIELVNCHVRNLQYN